MRVTLFLVAVLMPGLMLAPAPSFAQGANATALPAPPLGENATASDFLHAATSALVSGRVGEAQEALEMAQTRILDRSVPLYETRNASTAPAVEAITRARAALAAGDRSGALQGIEAANAALRE